MFDDVDVGSLVNAINSCKSSLDYSTTESLISSISNSSVWEADCKSNLKTAMEKLIVRNKDIEKMLDHCLSVASLIERYKSLEEEQDILRENCEYYRQMMAEDEENASYYGAKLDSALRRIDAIEQEKKVILNKINGSL